MPLDPLIGKGRIAAHEERLGLREPVQWHDGSLVFETLDWQCAETELEWVADYHLIVLTNYGSTALTEVRGEGRPVFEGRDGQGALSFVPAGIDRKCAYKSADLNYSALWISPQLADRWDLPSPGSQIRVNGADGVIGAIMHSLRDELAEGGSLDAAYVEQAARLVVHRLAHLDGRSDRKIGGRFSRTTLARIDDFIDAHLKEQISLADLAALAGVSVDGFARRFKATTGQTAYAWILERRVRRAADRLRGGATDLGRLALEVGFSSQSHLTTTFRRLRGTTPAAWRRQNFPVS